VGDYRRLEVWRKAHGRVLQIYRVTAGYPEQEVYGLRSQTRRAATSIPINLAEGCGRNSDKELARFCRVALGSANELEYELLLARDLGLMSQESHDALHPEVSQLKAMLAGLAARVDPRPYRRSVELR
jgi:four helix bundle protein